MVLDPATAAMVGAMLGFLVKPDGRIEPIDYSKLAAALDGSEIAFVKKVAIDTSEARDAPGKKFTQAGMHIFVKNPAGTTLPVYIRFNRPDGEEFELTALRRIRGPFGSFYIRNEAGVGTLNLIVTKGFQFEFSEAVSATEIDMDLNSLTDVYVPSPTDQYILYWKDADSRYELQAITGFQASIDHGSIAGLSGDDHSQYFNVTRHTKVVHDALGLDHGSLSGLTDDDHTQYLNVARHDADDHSGGILSPFPSATSIGGKTLPTGVIVGTTDTQSLSSKTLTTPVIASLYQVALGNLISFPVASIADTVCLLAEGQTLENKTLTTPTIADLSNMTHAHTSAATGGDYPWADFVGADVTYLQALVADITQTNLVDKSATEAIAGSWTLTSPHLTTSLILDQTTANYTISWADPGAARALSIADPGGNDTFCFIGATQILANKTLTTPTIADLTNMAHSHQNAAGGAQLDHGAALTGLLDDDHTQYQKETEKGAASGYASLDASTKVVERLAYEAAASGVATLDASSKVVQDPATGYLPLAGGLVMTGTDWGRSVDNSYLNIWGGATLGTVLQLGGKDYGFPQFQVQVPNAAKNGVLAVIKSLGGTDTPTVELVGGSFVVDYSGNITTVGTVDGHDLSVSLGTMRFWVPPSNAGTSTPTALGDFGCWLLDAATEYLYFNFGVPANFSSLTAVKLFGVKVTTGTIDWTATTDFAADGEVYTTHSDSATGNGLSMTANEVEDVTITAAFTGLAAGDKVGVKFILDAISAGEYRVIGLEFTYSAS